MNKERIKLIVIGVIAVITLLAIPSNSKVYLKEIQIANQYREMNNRLAEYPATTLQMLKERAAIGKLTTKDVYTYFIAPEEQKETLYDELIDANPYKRDLYKEVLFLIESNKEFKKLSAAKSNLQETIQRERKHFRHRIVYSVHKTDIDNLYK